MPDSDHASSLTPEQRRSEIAAILARGLLRHRRMAKAAAASPPLEIRSQTQNCLDLPRESRLPVVTGSAG